MGLVSLKNIHFIASCIAQLQKWKVKREMKWNNLFSLGMCGSGFYIYNIQPMCSTVVHSGENLWLQWKNKYKFFVACMAHGRDDGCGSWKFTIVMVWMKSLAVNKMQNVVYLRVKIALLHYITHYDNAKKVPYLISRIIELKYFSIYAWKWKI
jgi:hypothetical protein